MNDLLVFHPNPVISFRLVSSVSVRLGNPQKVCNNPYSTAYQQA
jgi:hypothetical protein